MHTTGQLEGQVLGQWSTDSSLHICPVCSRLISARTRLVCQRFLRTINNPVSRFIEGPLHPDTPNLEEVRRFPLRTNIPKAAQEAWDRCRLAALSEVTTNNDTQASLVHPEAGSPPGTRCNRTDNTTTSRQTQTTPRTISRGETSEPQSWQRGANCPRLAGLRRTCDLQLRVSRQGYV